MIMWVISDSEMSWFCDTPAATIFFFALFFPLVLFRSFHPFLFSSPPPLSFFRFSLSGFSVSGVEQAVELVLRVIRWLNRPLLPFSFTSWETSALFIMKMTMTMGIGLI